MAEEPCLEVTTIGRYTCEVAKSLEAIEGVEKVVRADNDSGKLVVAIQQGTRGPVLKEIGRISGVIHAD